MGNFVKLTIIGFFLFASLQLIRPNIPEGPPTAEWQAPPQVKHVLEKGCYSCHSNRKRLAWFDQIVPGYWLVRHDILSARQHLNFSTLGSTPAAAQKAALYEAVNMIQLGAMPLSSYRQLHPEAKVTSEDLAVLKNYLAPWVPIPNPPGSTRASSGSHNDAAPAAVPVTSSAPASLSKVQPEWNGLAFDSNFGTWTPISTTDRGDNDTFRFILANGIAIKAVQSGSISPWPEGARLAKVAWQKQPGPDGLLYPGKFIQVELMVKDTRHDRSSDGWAWGRWRGLDLKPYGKDASFVGECTGCHQPVHGDDYVYTLPITAAHLSRTEVVNNAAMLPAHLPYQPLNWRAITMYVDPPHGTMATLYGNEMALQAIKANTATSAKARLPSYRAGAILALITWSQREDPHWFGGRMPDRPQLVEFVQVAVAGETPRYRHFAGSHWAENNESSNRAGQRTAFILGLPPAQLP